jgi:hypothetical protein
MLSTAAAACLNAAMPAVLSTSTPLTMEPFAVRPWNLVKSAASSAAGA